VSLLALRQMLPLPEHMPLIIVRLCFASGKPNEIRIAVQPRANVPLTLHTVNPLKTDDDNCFL